MRRGHTETRLSARARHVNQAGGAGRDRTDDLKLAKLPLSQLSYSPEPMTTLEVLCSRLMMVGLGRLELPTSRLSGVRSNHLSYRPECQAAPSV
jgi:hypothetical protein